MTTSPPGSHPFDGHELWREATSQPRRPVGRRERLRLREIALRLEWVRVDSCRRDFAENLVWWAEEHLDHPAQRLWLVRLWTLNRAHGLARRARENDDLARAFAADLRRFAPALARDGACGGEGEAEGTAERDFLTLWAELHDDRDTLPDIEAALQRVLEPPPTSFTYAIFRLREVEALAEAIARHQHEPERLLLNRSEHIAWFMDRAESCPIEASWMRHCGNRGAPREGDRLVSLRRRETRRGVPCWRPLLTGVLDADNLLVELKGPENKCPPRELNRWIVWLLAHPRVRGLKLGTRALPGNDFVIWTLSRDRQLWLRERRPGLLVLLADGECEQLGKLVAAPPLPMPRITWRDWLGWVSTAALAIGMVFAGLVVYVLLVTVFKAAILNLQDALR